MRDLAAPHAQAALGIFNSDPKAALSSSCPEYGCSGTWDRYQGQETKRGGGDEDEYKGEVGGGGQGNGTRGGLGMGMGECEVVQTCSKGPIDPIPSTVGGLQRGSASGEGTQQGQKSMSFWIWTRVERAHGMSRDLTGAPRARSPHVVDVAILNLWAQRSASRGCSEALSVGTSAARLLAASVESHVAALGHALPDADVSF